MFLIGLKNKLFAIHIFDVLQVYYFQPSVCLGSRGGELTPPTSITNALLANLSHTPFTAGGSGQATINVISATPLMNPVSSTLAAPLPLVLNPSTLAPVLASNTLVSPVIASTGHPVRWEFQNFFTITKYKKIMNGEMDSDKISFTTNVKCICVFQG